MSSPTAIVFATFRRRASLSELLLLGCFNTAGFQEVVVEAVPQSSCFAVVPFWAVESCDMQRGGMRSFVVNFPDVVVDVALFAKNPDPAQLTVEQDWFLRAHWPVQLLSRAG